MSKVLKFIVHFVVICTLICVLGLVLPPFFGVRTVIVDKSDKATNLPVGSVTYAIPERSAQVLRYLYRKIPRHINIRSPISMLPREPEQ